ncbi:MAG: hypothetical protein ACHQQR_12275 [Gemmatimonadales bacterium]
MASPARRLDFEALPPLDPLDPDGGREIASVEGAATAGDGPSVPPAALSTAQVAQRLGIHPSTVKAHAVQLGGEKTREGWRFPLLKLQRVTESISIGGERERSSSKVDTGDRDARVVAALEQGKTIADIVIAERVPVEQVIRLRGLWRQGHALDQEGVKCRACGGAPDPRFAVCSTCAPRARVLSDEQAAVLHGAKIEPGTCGCFGCGSRVPTMNAAHVCNACVPLVGVVVDGARLHVVVGGTVLRTLTADEVRGLVGQLGQLAPMAAVPGATSAPLGAAPLPPAGAVEPLPAAPTGDDAMPSLAAFRQMQKQAAADAAADEEKLAAMRRRAAEGS